MPENPQETVGSLAQKIRTKYPGSYDQIADDVLVNKWVEKYPVYKDYLVAPTSAPANAPATAASASAGVVDSISAVHRSGWGDFWDKTARALNLRPRKFEDESKPSTVIGGGGNAGALVSADAPLVSFSEFKSSKEHTDPTVSGEIVKAVTDTGSGFTTPGNVAMMALLHKAGPKLGAGNRAVSGYFGGQALLETVKEAPKTLQEYQRLRTLKQLRVYAAAKNSPKDVLDWYDNEIDQSSRNLAYNTTATALNAVFGVGMAKHALTKTPLAKPAEKPITQTEPARGLSADIQGAQPPAAAPAAESAAKPATPAPAQTSAAPAPTGKLPEVKRGTYLDKIQKAGKGTQATELSANSLGKAAFGDGNFDVTKAPDGRFTVTRKEATPSTQERVATETQKAVQSVSADKPLAVAQPAPKAKLPERRMQGASAITPEVLNTPELEAATAERIKRSRISELEDALTRTEDPVEQSMFNKELRDLKGEPPLPAQPSKPAAEPRYVYRVRNTGEQGIPLKPGHAEASSSLDHVKAYAFHRTEAPQEVIRLDLNKLDPASFDARQHSEGMEWVKFKTEIPESAVENLGPFSREEAQAALDKNLEQRGMGKPTSTEPSKTAQAKAEVRARKAEQAGPLSEQVTKLQEERARLVARQERMGRTRPVNDREQAAIIRVEAQRRIDNLRRQGAKYDEILRVQAEAKAKIKNLPKLTKPEVGDAEAKWLERRIGEIDLALKGDDTTKGLGQKALEARAAGQPMPELRKGRPTKTQAGAIAPEEAPAKRMATAQPFSFMGPGAIAPETAVAPKRGGVVDSADIRKEPLSKGQTAEEALAEIDALHKQTFGSYRDAMEHGATLYGAEFEVKISKDGKRFKPVKKNPVVVNDEAWKQANVNNPNWADEQLAELQRQGVETPKVPVASAKKPLAVAPKPSAEVEPKVEPQVETKPKINPDATYSSREQAEFAGEQLHGKGNFAIVESQSVTGKTQFRALKTGATAVAEVAKPQVAVPVAAVTEGDTIKAQLPSGTVVEGKVEVIAPNGYKIRTSEGKALLVKPEWRVGAEAAPAPAPVALVPAPEVVAQTKAISSVPEVKVTPAPVAEPVKATPAVPEKSFLVKKIEREIAYAEKQIEKAQAAGDMDKADAMAGGLAAKRARLEKIKNAQKGNVAEPTVAPKETNVQKSVEAPATPRATDSTPAVATAKLAERAQTAMKLKADVIGEYPFTEPLVKEIETLLKADPAVSTDGKYGLFEKSLKTLIDGLHKGDPRVLERTLEIAMRRNEAGFAGTAPRQFRFNSRMARAIANGHVEVMVRQWERMTDSELALRQVADTITSPNFEKQVELANDPNLAQRVADVRSRAGRASWEDPTETLAKTFEGVTLTPKDLAMGAKREHLGENARQKEIMYNQLNKPVGYAESGLSKPQFAYEWAKNRIGLRSKLDGYISSWDHRPVEDMVAFIDRMENGDFNSMSPQDRVIGEKLRELLDTKRDEIYGLGEGYFENYLENYFPHIWTDPSKGSQLIHRIMGSKTPLGGPQGFLKGRTIEFFKEGLKPQYDAEGKMVRPALTPVTYNPIQMALIRLHEMDRFLMAHRIKADLESQGLTKFYRSEKEVPAGWARLDDKTFRSFRPEEKYELVDKERGLYQKTGTTGKFIENGGWYAPTGAAKVINNYLSPGLRGSKVFRGIRWYGNALNQAQLGLSAFHLTFTGLIDTPISTIALGTKQLLRGVLRADAWSAKKGVENTLKGFSIIPAIGESVFRGNRMLAEYMEPGQFAEYTRSVEALVEAGGRVRMDPYYRNNSVETVKRLGKEMSLAWRDPNINAWAKGSKLGVKGVGAIVNGAATVLEKAAVPVMEVVVPRMKLGLFYRLAEDVFHRVGPDAPHELVRAELGKAWDTVDNRMGQLVYDNLDWNKTMKDLAMISIRSVGWNYGTWREIGGGLKDTVVNTTKAVKSGNLRRVELTDRMTYLPAMVAYVGMLGAMTTFAATGEMPKSTDDYFFPRTGNKNPDGTDERVEWASYMKDLYPLVVGSIKTGENLGLYAGISRAGVMLGHKIHPVIGQSIELAENQDYYGRELVHTGDNGFKQSWQIMSHYVKGFEPLTFRNAAERKRSGASFGGQIAAGFGLVPAPKWLGQTPAQEYVFEMSKRHMEVGPKTAAEFEKNQLMRQLEMQLDTGRIAPPAIYDAVKEGKINLDDADKLLDDMTEEKDPLLRHFKRLNEEEALGGWERANKEEQQKLSEMMDDKVNLALDKLDADKANEFFQRYIKATKR